MGITMDFYALGVRFGAEGGQITITLASLGA